MNSQKLTLEQAWLATWHFLIGLWMQDQKRFLEKGLGLGAYLNFLSLEYKQDMEWRRIYYQQTSKDWNDLDTLFPGEILKIMRSLLGKASEKYGFELSEVKRVVNELQTETKLNKSYFLLWKESIARGISGSELTGFDRSYWEWQDDEEMDREDQNKKEMVETEQDEEKIDSYCEEKGVPGELCYDAVQAWTAMLIFFDYLVRNGWDQFGNFQWGVGYLFSSLHIDSECFKEWQMIYEKIRPHDFRSIEQVLSKSEVMDLVKSYIGYYQHSLGLDIKSLPEIIQKRLQTAAEKSSDFIAWEDALNRSRSGEIWKQASCRFLRKYCGDFCLHDSMDVPDKLFEQLRPEFEKLPEDALERFLCLYSAFDDLHFLEWENYYVRTTGKPYRKQKMLSYEIFITTVAFVAKYAYQYSFDSHELIRMFYGMQSKPQEYAGNWELWREICKKVALQK